MRRFLTRRDSLLVSAQWLTALAFPLMLLGPAPLEIATSLVAVLFLVHSALARDWSWLKPDWVRLLFALWIWSIACSVIAEDVPPAISRSLLWIRYVVLAPAMAYWVLPDAKAQRRVLTAIAGSLLFLCVDSVIQYIVGHDLFGRAARVAGEQIRLTGPFSNPRVGITLVWIAFPVLCVLLANPKPRRRLLAVALTAAVVVVAFMSGERMAFLLSILSVALTFVLVPRARLPLFVAGVVAALALGGMMAMKPALKQRQVGQSSSEITGFWESSYGRLWLSSLSMVKQHPITGVGPRNFRSACPHPRYGSMDPDILHLRCTLHPHNMYMEWLSETGLIGFGLFCALITDWLCMLWAGRRAIFTDALLAGLVVTLLVRLWPLAATTSQFAGWSAGPFWILTGWLFARLKAAKRAV